MADNFELYRQAVLLVGEVSADWGADFAVITAFNPNVREPGKDSAQSARLNQAAHLRLKADLLRLTKPRWLPPFLLYTFRFLLRDGVCAVTG